jgi:hypothetical protein
VLLCLSTVKRTQSSQSVDVRDAAQLEWASSPCYRTIESPALFSSSLQLLHRLQSNIIDCSHVCTAAAPNLFVICSTSDRRE